ncbi:MAG: hypothetical protein BGP22_24630 [Variovorax sp. 67-131]|nr:MAG: hypothetical protein BGP22_24630 [Variovorax sp. 67-131]
MDDDGPAPAFLVAAVAGLADFLAAVSALAGAAAVFLGGALFSFAVGPGTAAETFFAAGAACFAAATFFAAGLVAGVALAAGFFTVTGSLIELERAFTGCLLPWEPVAAFRPRGLHVVGVLANGEPRGYTPESPPETCGAPCRKSHPVRLDGVWLPEQARDCIENSKARAMCPGAGRVH